VAVDVPDQYTDGIIEHTWDIRACGDQYPPVGEKFDYAGSILYCIALSTVLLALNHRQTQLQNLILSFSAGGIGVIFNNDSN